MPSPDARRREDRVRLEASQHQARVVVDEVGLVEDHDLGDVARSDIADHIADGRELSCRIRVRGVHDVDDHVGAADLFQRGAEGLDELVRQVADEPDRVGERVHAAVGRARAAHGRIQRREQGVLDEHAGARQPVEQARLAGVRVTGDRHGGDRVALALGALGVARGREVADLTAQLRHAGADAPAIEFDLGLTGTTRAHAGAPGADLATGLAAHRVAPAAQAREQVLELGQLDLRLALAALGVLAEDVEDHGRAVDDLDLHDVLERTTLAGGEFGVGDDRVGADGRDDVAELLCLAAPDVGRRVGMGPALQDGVEHHGTGGLGERGELAQRVLGIRLLALRVHADEHDVLEPQLPVLDLGDVLELGREPRHAPQRGPLLAIPLVAVGVGAADRRLVLEGLRGAEGCRRPPSVKVLTRTPERASARASTRSTGSTGVSSVLWGVVVSVMCSFRDAAIRHPGILALLNGAPPGTPELPAHSRGGEVLRYARSAMGSDHYFSASPASAENLRRIRVTLAERDVEVTTAGGVFSPDHVDSGTGVLLANTPPPPPGGNLLDLGSGWGPIALSLAMQSPHATIWAVDVNERALDLVRRNARLARLSTMSTPRFPRMFPTTSCSARSARTRPSASARTSCTACSSAGSRVWKSDRMPGSSCSATSGRTRCSAGWRPPSTRASACTAPRRVADSACSRCAGTARRRASPSRCPERGALRRA